MKLILTYILSISLNIMIYNEGLNLAWTSIETDKYKQLTTEQENENAKMLRNYFESQGWVLESICGAIGCMYYESSGLNPGQWQGGFGGMWSGDPKQGVGLPQFTPYTKWTNYAQEQGFNYYDGDKQAEAIHTNWNGQWGVNIPSLSHYSPRLPYEDFQKNINNSSVEQLTTDFMVHYERIINDTLEIRQNKAIEFWEFFKDEPYVPPTPGGVGSSGRFKSYWVRPKRALIINNTILKI